MPTKTYSAAKQHGQSEQLQLSCKKARRYDKHTYAFYEVPLMRRTSQEAFIAKAKKRHGAKYDYRKAVYVGKNLKVCIICPIHGEFWQTPDNHYQFGCIACGRTITIASRLKSHADFLAAAIKIHGNKYDYAGANYIGAHAKLRIICRKHGEFLQTANSHAARGSGCPKCARENQSNLRGYKATRFYSGVYKDMNFLSLRELFWIIAAEKNAVDFIAIDQPTVRQKWCVPVINKHGKPATYCGDFYICEKNTVIDIKPDWRIIKEAAVLLQASNEYAKRGYLFETVDCDNIVVDDSEFVRLVRTGKVTLFATAAKMFRSKFGEARS